MANIGRQFNFAIMVQRCIVNVCGKIAADAYESGRGLGLKRGKYLVVKHFPASVVEKSRAFMASFLPSSNSVRRSPEHGSVTLAAKVKAEYMDLCRNELPTPPYLMR